MKANLKQVGNAFRSGTARAKKSVANIRLKVDTRKQTAPIKRALDFVVEEMERFEREYGKLSEFYLQSVPNMGFKESEAIEREFQKNFRSKVLQKICRNLRLKRNDVKALERVLLEKQNEKVSAELLKKVLKELEPYSGISGIIKQRYKTDVYNNVIGLLESGVWLNLRNLGDKK